jgi:hypothetical protein
MNERIRQLAEQAFFDENTNQPSDKMYTFTEHKMKQFAELIVQKCADIGQQYADGNYEVRNQILEHFGLEEE